MCFERYAQQAISIRFRLCFICKIIEQVNYKKVEENQQKK